MMIGRVQIGHEGDCDAGHDSQIALMRLTMVVSEKIGRKPPFLALVVGVGVSKRVNRICDA